MKTKKYLPVAKRRAIAEVQMAMIRAAGLDIKIIFPALGMKLPKTRASKNAHFTRKGAGRYHPNVKEIAAREAKKQKKEAVTA